MIGAVGYHTAVCVNYCASSANEFGERFIQGLGGRGKRFPPNLHLHPPIHARGHSPTTQTKAGVGLF